MANSPVNVAALVANMAAGKAAIKVKPTEKNNKRLTGRRYDIVGHRLNGEVIRYDNVAAVKANAIRKQLRMEGCHRVDKIEVVTKVNGQEIVFTEKNHIPAHVGRIPVTVTATERKIADDRAKMHQRNILSLMKSNRSRVSQDNRIRIYDNDGEKIRNGKGKFMTVPKLVFVGDEAGAVFFILNTKKSLDSLTFYLPAKIVEGLR